MVGHADLTAFKLRMLFSWALSNRGTRCCTAVILLCLCVCCLYSSSSSHTYFVFFISGRSRARSGWSTRGDSGMRGGKGTSIFGGQTYTSSTANELPIQLLVRVMLEICTKLRDVFWEGMINEHPRVNQWTLQILLELSVWRYGYHGDSCAHDSSTPHYLNSTSSLNVLFSYRACRY